MALTDKQEAFCQAFVLTRNATDAARKAGYAGKHSNSQGYRLMQLEEIKLRIEDLGKELSTDIDVVSEVEAQYKAAKNQGQGQVSLKALELLSRVRGNLADESEKDVPTLRANIIRCMEIVGKEEVELLIKECEFK